MVYKKIILIFSFLLLICIFAPPSLALSTYIYEIPDPRKEKLWITDLANIIEPETENKLNQILTEVNLKYRSEIVILTVPDVSPYQSPRQLAKYIFNIWHITRIGFNNGALFLISQHDRTGEIIAGFMNDPTEPTYEDKKFQANVKKITTIDISDLFAEERYEQGILLGTEELITLIKNKEFNRMSKYF
jgi:uncharacterized protein